MSEATGGPAILVLEDGRVFHGRSFGATGETFGEIVFNTGMTGYQETLTDPSYHRQIVAMTAPHIGNTGVNDDDPESGRIWVAGYVVREPARIPSNWRAQRTLDEELRRQDVVGIAMTGTRALTRHLRDKGAMRAAVSSVETDPKALLARVLEQPRMAGADLAGEVSTDAPYEVLPSEGVEVRFHVAAVDLGIKAMTPQRLAERGCRVTVLPSSATAEDLLALDPDGVFFSNGPGDPATADGPVAAVRGVLDAGKPLFGICFGNQILGRALGLGTYKLPFGHRGVNQPVIDTATGKVSITSQNHGFAVDAPLEGTFETPYGRAQVSHIGLNDQVVEGLRLLDRPVFSVQFHPEAAAGPHDAAGLFDEFVDLMSAAQPTAAAEQ
ncbi:MULTISPECIES: glutamine-hydrolyzing carbamoyl-phosphate synthase small subunit [unclassified Nocardiopsis]|uniref:glutamine-hydrolyzing carbamoyl-phosphate synthase small subunit n=1 Tax=Nocardiopsis TaxID=2013 RepID=UPI00387B1432